MKKFNTIIDKEAMYDLMVRLTEVGIKWKLVNDRVVAKVYDDCGFGSYDTFEIVIFKDRFEHVWPWNIHRVEDDRDFREKDIESLIDWLLY